jgi:hypothetical protein
MKMSEKKTGEGRRVVLLLFGLLLICTVFSADVSALGITPGRTTIEFEPGLSRVVPFSVINNEHKDMRVVFRVEGELAQYVSIQQALADFSSSEDTKEFSYMLQLPAALEKPGAHTAQVIAMEIPSEKTAGGYYVGATVAVATEVYVRVPYPGKYAELKMSIVGGSDGEPVNFYGEVLNFGQEDILRAKARVDIMGPTNEIIASVETDEKSVKSKERGEVVATWMPDANVNPGVYHAVMILDYDGELAKAESNFNVGNILLDVISVEVDRFKLGEIAKFNILVESKWNEKVTGAYAQTILNNKEGGVIADFNSASEEVEPFSQKEMTAYWDTFGIKEGVYDGKIVLHYSGRTTERKLQTDIKLNSLKATIIGGRAINIGGEGFKVSKLLVFLVVLLVGINAAWFFYFNKKLKKKEGVS